MLVEIVIMKVAHLVVDDHSACYKCLSFDRVFSSLALAVYLGCMMCFLA
jgi:hypothetical protein